MSEVTTTLIPIPAPANPNLPDGVNIIPLHPISLILGFDLDCVWEFPGSLDRNRLIKAIQSTAILWPVVGGRLSHVTEGESLHEHDSRLGIRLAGRPVHFDEQKVVQNCAKSDPAVIVKTTLPFNTSLHRNNHLPESDSPLVTVRLTTLLPSGRSVLGLVFDHVIFDGYLALRFSTHLSHFYVDPAYAPPLHEYPTFFPHLLLPKFPPDEDSNVVKFARELSLLNSRDRMEGNVDWDEFFKGANMASLYLSQSDINCLVTEVKARDPALSSGGERLSEQDILSGWWVCLLERSGQPITHMTYTLNYRGMKGPFGHNMRTLCANGIGFWRFALPQSAATFDMDPAGRALFIAKCIRRELRSFYENPQALTDFLCAMSFRYDELLRTGKSYLPLAAESEVFINSNLRYDWVVPFGFDPSEIKYHTSFAGPRGLRVFRSNPTPAGRGDAEDGRGLGSIEMTFRIEPEIGMKMYDLSESDKRRWRASRVKI